MFTAYKQWLGRAALVSAVALATLPAAATAGTPSLLRAGLERSSDQGMVGFYRTREHRALWTGRGEVDAAAAQTLISILDRAPLDGMDDGPALARRIERAVALAGSGDAELLAEAELLMSRAWVQYVQTLRRPVRVGMTYAPGAVSPAAPFTAEILNEAAAADDLRAHLLRASALNPVYNQLREALAALQEQGGAILASTGSTAVAEQRLRLNLDRARALPVQADGRFILVDAANAQMYLYEDGQVRDSMKVIVGKPGEQTPMLAGLIQTAVLNPYWNVPQDLVRKRVAAGVLSEGLGYLTTKRYEVLSDWSADARKIDPATVDWAAVAAGTTEVRVRQLPGGTNAMGSVKFMFPNDFGVYLHDTPEKALFAESDRRLSSGCVRVEDAGRVATWLFGRTLKPEGSDPEQIVKLSAPMPVYVTYLTAGWDGQRLALGADGYGRDRAIERLASASNAW